MTKLKLKAESVEDLAVLSSVLQDAILRVGEIKYSFKSRYLSLRMSRFSHEKEKNERILCGLRIDGVTGLKSKNLERNNAEALAVLLSIEYCEDTAPPGGQLRIVLAGGGEICAEVECLDVILADVAAARQTSKIPYHPLDSDG